MTNSAEESGQPRGAPPSPLAAPPGNANATLPAPAEARPAPQTPPGSLHWLTPAALAWGPPMRMWASMVAAVWRPFLPPTALTHGQRPAEPAPSEALPARREVPDPATIPGTTPRRG